jgi:RecA/RadA recombinase
MAEQRQQIFIKGEDKTGQVASWKRNGDKVDVKFWNGKVYSYNIDNVRIVESALTDPESKNCFDYLAQIAGAVGLADPNGGNILADRYAKIDFLSEESILAAFLTGSLKPAYGDRGGSVVYPFGFNISQKAAAENALISPLSIIEGPPGTGKTQTILNIIANAVIRGWSVAVVSSNNAATANVLEKLKKYNVDFIAAYLGNTDNKREFIESQKPLPDFSAWALSPDRSYKLRQSLNTLFISLEEMLAKKNELSRLKQEQNSVDLEYRHFLEYLKDERQPASAQFKTGMSASTALELWLLCEEFAQTGKKPGLIARIVQYFKYGIKRTFFDANPESLITACQKHYYEAKLSELGAAIEAIERLLSSYNFDDKMREYSDLSAELFRDNLAKKYKGNSRPRFSLDDLWKNSEAFISVYPVILSTTYSLRSSLSHKVMYDYVIIDESSQVDLATGALALSCAKNAVVVGDLKQLPNVVDSLSTKKTDAIFERFDLPEVYRYKNHSLLSAMTELFPNAPRTLLREHYRCHPQIIEFCNQKFYGGELIVLTEPKSTRKPLVVYQTAEGNHARERVNQRQIDVIKDEVIPQQKIDLTRDSVGIVTPYRNQTNALQTAFADTTVKADTVDKFQGRENDIIVLSTVDNEVSEFSDNANRLNVAVSRAIEQLIVVVSAADTERDTNIGDLVRYIRYNNMEIIKSEIYSVFDYLYRNYAEKRTALLSKRKRVSEYDSENLMFALIDSVLKQETFAKFAVAIHVPLKMLIRDTSKLNDDEARYALNFLTHVDFLIFDKMDKSPRLIVEVDGVSFHKEGTRQAERDKMKNAILKRYGLRYVRFKTNESRERERLTAILNTTLN